MSIPRAALQRRGPTRVSKGKISKLNRMRKSVEGDSIVSFLFTNGASVSAIVGPRHGN